MVETLIVNRKVRLFVEQISNFSDSQLRNEEVLELWQQNPLVVTLPRHDCKFLTHHLQSPLSA